MRRRNGRVPLNVFMNDRHVGTLNREAGGGIGFRYHADWLSWSSALPVSLSMSLRDSPYRGAAVAAVFDNLLPDSDALRRRVAEKVGADGVFEQLYALPSMRFTALRLHETATADKAGAATLPIAHAV